MINDNHNHVIITAIIIVLKLKTKNYQNYNGYTLSIDKYDE